MSRFWSGLLALLILAPVSVAAEGQPTDRTTNDRLIIDQLARVHDRGAALFNSGDHAGCYRIFQGALMTARLVLPRELQDAVDRGLSRAEQEPSALRRAMALHELIEDVRRKLHPSSGKGEALPKPRSATTDAGDGFKRMPKVPGVPEPARPGDEPKVGDAGKPAEGPRIGDAGKPPQGPKVGDAGSSADPPANFQSPEPPRAPVAPPGRIHIDPPPPVLSGVPTSNPKSVRPMGDEEQKEPLTVPPRPADSAPPPPPLEIPLPPPEKKPEIPMLPKAAPMPAPPSDVTVPPLEVPLPPPEKKKSDTSPPPPPPLTAPGK